MGVFRRHWLAVLGAIPIVLEIWRWMLRILEWAEHTEFIVEHYKAVLAVILEPPWWANGPLIAGGLILIWLDLRRQRPNKVAPVASHNAQAAAPAEISTVVGSRVARWFTPSKAIDEFADKTLVQAAVNALNAANAAKKERDDNYKDKSPYQAIADDQMLGKKAEDAELAFYVARHHVLENLIGQLKEEKLIGRALPFDDKKLGSDRDWEYIKASHWSVLGSVLNKDSSAA